MKKCSKCGNAKPIDEFYRAAKELDGHRHACKSCMKRVHAGWRQRNRQRIKNTTERYRVADKQTWHGFFTSRWRSINRRTINGKWPNKSGKGNRCYLSRGVQVMMSKQEFKEFCYQHRNVIEDMYKTGQHPSIDRIDSRKHYEIGNLQILSMNENNRKNWQDARKPAS